MFKRSMLMRSLADGIKESVTKTFTLRKEQLPLTLNLVNFATNPNEMDNMVVKCDQNLGGYSTLYLDLGTNEQTRAKYAQFHGILNLDPPLNNPEVKYSGWSMFRTKHKNNFDHRLSYLFNAFGNFKWDLSPYTTLKLRVKADNRRYFVNFQIDDPQQFNLFQHRLFVQTPGEWETVFLPLDDFVLTNKGKILKQNHGEMNRDKIKSVGIGLTDRQYGPYSLCIESIELITDFDLFKLITNARNEHNELPDLKEKLSIE